VKERKIEDVGTRCIGVVGKKTATESKASALLKIGQASVVVVDVIIRHGVRMCITWIELSWVGLGWFVFRHILGNTLYVDWVVDGDGSKKTPEKRRM